MQKLQRAYFPEDQIARAVEDIMLLFAEHPETTVRHLGLPPGSTAGDVAMRAEEVIRADHANCQMWRNDKYQVAVYRNDSPAEGWPKMIHLSIKRNDREPIHDWRDLQAIKDELVGPYHEAAELYTARTRLVDTEGVRKVRPSGYWCGEC